MRADDSHLTGGHRRTQYPFVMFGLPLHPLVIHAVVVLLPLGALGVLACFFVPAVRRRYGGLVVGVVGVASASTVVAMVSGNLLAETVGVPVAHQRLGTWTVAAAILLLVLVAPWWWLARRDDDRPGQRPVGALALGSLSVTAALASLVLVSLAGHAGATATWESRLPLAAAPTSGPVSGSAPPPAGTPSSGTSTSGVTTTQDESYTLADVARHDDAPSCWAAIDGSVYDLTGWINQHPGGRDRILGLCGTDASAAFAAQHSGDSRPHTQLARFKIGDLD